MTKKDYIKFAELVREVRQRPSIDADGLAHRLSDIFRQDNARFDFERFYQATLEGK